MWMFSGWIWRKIEENPNSQYIRVERPTGWRKDILKGVTLGGRKYDFAMNCI